MRSLLFAAIAVWMLPIAALCADESQSYNEVRSLLQGRKVDEAAAALQKAQEEFPDSARLNSLLSQLAIGYMNQGNVEKTVEYANAFIDSQLQAALDDPRRAASVTSGVNFMLQVAARIDATESIEKQLDAALEKLAAKAKEAPAPEYDLALIQLRGIKAGRAATKEEALSQIDAVVADAKAAFAAQDSTQAALQLAAAYEARSSVLTKFAPEDAAAARQQQLDFLVEQVKARPDEEQLTVELLNTSVQQASSNFYNDPEAAERIIASTRELMNSIESPSPVMQSRIRLAERSFESLMGRLEAVKARNALIGQPAFDLDAEAWVNGEPLTDGDLKGKVVLIDFWAVWCGPCIATFPHLRQWQEKYADDGLVIIGATRYYQFDWDDEAKQIKRVADLSKEAEQAAMLKFAEHHELKHRFMVAPEGSQFAAKYQVSGIPQAVLIDREGKVRMIRVGSGEQNAHDLGQMIEQLVAGKNDADGK